MLKISADFENRLIYVTDDVTNKVTLLTQNKKFTKNTIQTFNFNGVDFSKSFDYIKLLTNVISDDTVIDLTATIIKNGNDLMSHGQQMKHCVGSYYNDCYENRYVVYSVKHGEINSTLGIWYIPNKSEFRLDQHYGHCNSEVSEVVKNFGKKVVDKLNQEIKLDSVKQVFQ